MRREETETESDRADRDADPVIIRCSYTVIKLQSYRYLEMQTPSSSVCSYTVIKL